MGGSYSQNASVAAERFLLYPSSAMRFSCFLLAMLLLSGCSAPISHQREFTMEDGFGSPVSLNPYQDPNWPTSVVTAELTLAFLVNRDSANGLQPDLASELPTRKNRGVSADGRTIVYHLRPNLRWSDGLPLTSSDVAFTVRVIRNPTNNIVPGPYTNILSVDTPDARTMVFHLKEAFADYASTFFATEGPNSANPILPAHAFKSTDISNASFNTRPIGAGPFRVVSWHRDSDILFERNPYYHGRPANLASIRYLIRSSIQTADVEFLAHEAQMWERIPELKIDSAKRVGTVLLTAPDAYLHLDFNVRRSAVRSVTVRRAVLLALDRVAIARDVSNGYGLPQEGVVSLANPLAAKLPFVGRDVRSARRLLASERPSLVLTYPAGDDMLTAIAELIRSDLADVGITLETRKFDPAFYYSTILVKGKWDMTMFNWTLDPSGGLEQLFSCTSFSPTGSNDMFYCNPKLDKLFARYDAAYGLDERRELLAREENIIDADTPTIVLFFRRFGYGIAPGVTGFRPPRDAPFDGFETVNAR
jgi:peptide/nickel transport system substrate-binding protein